MCHSLNPQAPHPLLFIEHFMNPCSCFGCYTHSYMPIYIMRFIGPVCQLFYAIAGIGTSAWGVSLTAWRRSLNRKSPVAEWAVTRLSLKCAHENNKQKAKQGILVTNPNHDGARFVRCSRLEISALCASRLVMVTPRQIS
jgi:hypothetical protein